MIARMFAFESIMLQCACHMSRHATRVHATRVASAKQKATVGPWTPTGEFIRHGMGREAGNACEGAIHSIRERETDNNCGSMDPQRTVHYY